MFMLLTTFETSQKYNVSTSHLRRLLASKTIKGRQAAITPKRVVWLVDELSIKSYLKKDRKPGPKKKK